MMRRLGRMAKNGVSWAKRKVKKAKRKKRLELKKELLPRIQYTKKRR